MYAFPSQDWANAYKDALNQSATYKEAAKDWTHGSVSMIVKANPSIGIASDIGLILDVDQGNCRAATVVSAEEAQAAPFVIIADYAQWKSVMKGELDPIKGMMQGKLKLTKGHMPTIVKYVHSNRALVATIGAVATKFPDE